MESNIKEINYTFIIPHHNCPELLDRCLNSIPHRDDIQIIVVDDNSDLEKKPIECERAEVEYIYIGKGESKGAGCARNRGLEKAKGRWLLFPDADDFYIDGFITIIDKYAHDSIDVLYFGYNFLDENNKSLNDTIETCIVLSQYEETEYNADLIRYKNYAPWSKMVRRKYIEKFAMKFEEVKNGNDILFSLLVASYSNNYKVESSPLYVYVRNENSLTTQKLSTTAHMCKIEHFVKLTQFYRKIGHPEWSISCIRYIFYVLKMEGLSNFFFLFVAYIKAFSRLFNERNEFVGLTHYKDTIL